METIYIKKYINSSEDLPPKGRYIVQNNDYDMPEYMTMDNSAKSFWSSVNWYLLPVQLPTEEEILKASKHKHQYLPHIINSLSDVRDIWIDGVDWLINKLKG